MLDICSVIPASLAEDARRAGVLPDMRGWAVADILLFAAESPHISTRVVEATQRRTYGDSAMWTHAALYVGGGMLVESVAHAPTMVILRGIDAHVPASAVVRMHDGRLTPEDRVAISAEAKGLLNVPYSFARAAAIGAKTLFGHMRMPRSRKARLTRNTVIRGCVCSDVIEMAYNAAVGLSAAPDTRGFVPPAAFHRRSVLEKHEVSWCRLP